jgi:hypothetical protein
MTYRATTFREYGIRISNPDFQTQPGAHAKNPRGFHNAATVFIYTTPGARIMKIVTKSCNCINRHFNNGVGRSSGDLVHFSLRV